MKIVQFSFKNIENHETRKIPNDNHENLENHIIQHANYEKHRNLIIPYENYENHENHIISFEKYENHKKVTEFHMTIMKIIKSVNSKEELRKS